MGLWTQFGEENPVQTRENVLTMIEYQDTQLARVTDPIISDVEQRIENQEQALREVYKPITADIKRQVKRQCKQSDTLKQRQLTNEVLSQYDKTHSPTTTSPQEANNFWKQFGNCYCVVCSRNPTVCEPGTDCMPGEGTNEADTAFSNMLSELQRNNCTIYSRSSDAGTNTACFSGCTMEQLQNIALQFGVQCRVFQGMCDEPGDEDEDIDICDPGDEDEDDKIIDKDKPPPQCCPEVVIPPCPPTEVINNIECKPEIKIEIPPQECCPQDGSVKGENVALQDPVEPGQLWEPDTERICDLMTGYINRFTAVGEAVLGNISSTATAASTVSAQEGAEPVTNVVLSAILPIVGAINPSRFVGVIAEVVRGLSNSISAGMIAQGTAYVGLQVIRLVLDSLENTTIGWNLGPAVMLNIRISLRKEKQVLDYLQNFLWPVGIPTTPDVSTLLVTGEISTVHAECLWRMNNNLPRLEHKLNYARRPQVSPNALAALNFREDGTVFDLYARLRGQGWQDVRDVGELVNSSLFIPPPSDAISMAVKDVFDPNLFARDLMEREYRNQRGLDALFRANGIGDVHIKGIDPQNGDNVDVGLLYWYAHYQHCSPTQVYEMLHRLRPHRVAKWTLPGQTPEQVRGMITGIDEVRNLLKLNDYNPFWRDRLAAIAYRVIGRIDVRRFYHTSVFGRPLGRRGFRVVRGGFVLTGQAEKELGESYQDMGYSPDDAIKLAVYTATDFDNKRIAGKKNEVKGQVCEAMAVGYANEETLARLLIDSGFEADEANSIILACRLKFNVAKLKRAITLVKRSVLGNRLQPDAARVILGQLGVIPERINDYISVWELDVRMRAKEPEAEKLCSWFGAGFLTLDEFMVRLTRLGYTQTDVKRIVAHCYVGIQAKRGKELAKMAKMLDKGKKDAERREREKLRKFLSARTDANLIAWYKAGEITLTDIIWTLQHRGWAAVDIKRWIRKNLGVEHDQEIVDEVK